MSLRSDLEVLDNETCIVHPSKLSTPKSELSSYNDHRIFMTLAIITKELEVSIDNENCINKSYPTFIEELKNLRLRFRGSENQRIIDLNKSREKNETILWND